MSIWFQIFIFERMLSFQCLTFIIQKQWVWALYVDVYKIILMTTDFFFQLNTFLSLSVSSVLNFFHSYILLIIEIWYCGTVNMVGSRVINWMFFPSWIKVPAYSHSKTETALTLQFLLSRWKSFVRNCFVQSEGGKKKLTWTFNPTS